MQDIIQQITLPASRDSQAAFETSAEELIRRHQAVLAGRSHAIRLAVDLLCHHLLPGDQAGVGPPGLATLTFFSNEGSVQQLIVEFACPGSVPEMDALGESLLGGALGATVMLAPTVDGSVGVRVARRSRLPRGDRLGDELEMKGLRDAVWLLLLARAWKSVTFHQREGGEVAARLLVPKPVPRRLAKRPSA